MVQFTKRPSWCSRQFGSAEDLFLKWHISAPNPAATDELVHFHMFRLFEQYFKGLQTDKNIMIMHVLKLPYMLRPPI